MVIPQKPPPPPTPRRQAEVPLDPSDPPDRPTIPMDPPASQPPPAPRVQAAPRSRRGTGRMEIPGPQTKPEIIGRRSASHSDPLLLLAFDPFRSSSARYGR